MTVLTVVLALLAALGNAAASVLQRRGTTQVDGGGAAVARWWSWATRLLRRRVWLWGAALLAVSGLCQAAALAADPLAVVQPVMTTELLFTMVIGSAVFRRCRTSGRGGRLSRWPPDSAPSWRCSPPPAAVRRCRGRGGCGRGCCWRCSWWC
ncbi:hypothetical protein ACFQVA_39170 [Actinomadura keratinilytica]